MENLTPFNGELDQQTSLQPFEGTLDGEKPKASGALRRGVADKALGFASGAVGATKAFADAAGAGNVVSSTLEAANKGINEYLSPEAKADQQEQAALFADAKAKGFNFDGVAAGAKAFAVAPFQAISQATGSIAPIIAGTALTGGAAPAAAVGAGIGAAIGAGTAKGAIYDEIKKRGGTEEEAIKAQEYGGVNTDQIALGGALGVADALTGASKMAGNLVRGALGKPVAEVATKAVERGVLGRAGMGMLGEMPLEAAQGGQEQVAANVAAQRAGYEAGTWDNVASNATLEALSSAGPGAAFGVMNRGAVRKPESDPNPVAEVPPSGQSTGVGAGMGGTEPPAFTTNPQPTTLGTQITATAGPGFDANSVLPKADPVRDMVQQSADAGGPISAAALVGIDSGAHETQLQAALLDEKVQAASKDMPADVADAWAQYRAESAALQQDQSQPDWAAQAAEEERMLAGRNNGTTNAVQSLPATGSGIDGNQQSASMGLGNADGNGLGADAGGYSAHPVVQSGEQSTAEPSVETTEKSKNLASLKEKVLAGRKTPQFQSNPQPTTLGTQTTAKAGPGFDASYLPKQGPQDGTETAQAVAPKEGRQETPAAEQVAHTNQPDNDGQPTRTKDEQLSISEQKDNESQTENRIPTQEESALISRHTKIDKTLDLMSDAQIEDVFTRANLAGKNLTNMEKRDALKQEHPDDIEPLLKPQPAQPAVNAGEGAGVSQPTQAAKLPPTDIRIGDKVLVDGKPHTVTQGVDGGVAVESDAKDLGSGVSNSQTRILKGDEAIKAKIAADDAGLNKQTRGVKPKKPSLKQRMEAERKARADYFTPGNIVKGYGEGHDEVISYTPPKEDGGGWSVKVHAVENVNGEWVRIGKPQDARTHSTHPDAQALKAGPVDKVSASDVGEANYTEVRADGKAFPNVPARPQKPEIVVDKAEMRPYRKPDGSVGYEAVPIQSETPVTQDDAADKAWWRGSLTLVGRERATIEIGVGPRFAAMGWQHIPEKIRTKLAALRASNWDPESFTPELDKQKAEKPGAVNVPPTVAEAFTAQMQKQKGRITRLKNEAEKAGSLDDKKAAQLKVTAAESTLRKMRTSVFDAEDAAVKAVESGNSKAFDQFADLFPGAAEEVAKLTGQNDELDAEMRSYEAKYPDEKPKAERKSKAKKQQTRRVYNDDGSYYDAPVEDAQSSNKAAEKAALSEREKAAKAKMHNALGKLAALASKNTRMNWTAEEEQQLLPIVIELFDGAVELGAVTFQKAVAYVRDFIAQGIDQETADAIPFETLQGAYIAMSGRHKDKAITPRKEVVAFDSLAELEKSAPQADTPAKDQANEPTNTGSENPQALGDMAPEQDGGTESKRRVGRGRKGRSAGSVSDDSGLTEPRVSGTRSGGSGSTSVRAPKPGGTGRGRRTGAGTEGNGSQLPAERGTVPVDSDLFSDKPAAEPVSANNIQATNFRITPDLRLGQGGESEKFRDNLAAIRTLKAIEAEGRRATSEEQRILARYVGWGGLANAFPSPETKEWKDDWKARGAELKDLLTAKEYDLARRSTLDSHYTSQTVVSAMWDAAKRLGFSGGMAAETSMGIGNFMGLMPEGIAGNTRFIGVEYDSLTARMAALLYPQATVLHSGLQKVPLPDSVFDLNIGNPPFGDQSLRFQFKPEFNRVSIHNQFFLAGIDSLKPGGLQLNVVSRYLLDAMDKTTRTMLAKKAKLVAAIRLPDTAFKENARTSVVTDIVMLQRLTPGEQAEMEAAFQAAASKPEKDREKEAERRALAALVPEWVEVTKMRDPLGGDPMTVNSYFAKNPGMILGTLERSGKMQFKNDITVRPSDRDLGEMLAEAVAKLPEGIANTSQDAVAASLERYTSLSDALKIALSGQEAGSIAFNQDGQMEQVYERETPEGDYELTKRVLTESSPWSESLYQDSKGNWFSIEAKLDEDGNKLKVMKDGKPTKANVYDRKMYASESEIPAGMRLGEKRLARLQKMVKLRDLMVNQINLETEDAPPIRMEGNRQKLAKAYRDFVESEGFISRQANSALVANMPDGALVQALELAYRKEITKKQADKLGESPRPEQADPAPILSERVIPKYEPPTKAASSADALSITMSESGRVDIERIASLLGKSEEEVIAEMFDKADKPLIFKDPETQQWVTRNDYLTGQVKKKLHAAQAAGLDKHVKELEAVQPEPWGAENVTVLLGSTFVPPQVYADFIEHVTGKPAKVSFQQSTNSYAVQANGATQEKQDEWGADGVTIAGMVTDMLNSTSIKVMTKNADNNLVFNKELTDLAQLKARQIASEFTDWAFANGDRRKMLVDLFNEKYNTRVSRQHDGSHLTLPGKVPDAILRMRRHQKNAIWRGISERFMLIDHAVGAGKTFTAIARAMERRRMGLSRKPAIVVPNHMVEQFTSDVYRLYPGAKVLAAGGKDFEKKKRRKLFAKIASGDWDIVIIPHSSFGFIGIAPETEERYLEKELALAEQAIKDAWEESEQAESSFRKPFNVKTAERLRDKITARMDSVRGNMNKDRLLTFEQMGIDDLTVDEAHEFKNLFYSTRLKDVKGMGNQSGSQKAFDLYNKVRVLRESPTGTVTFMTGTPISNSAVEMFTMMRYLAADELNELGLEHFDAWRAQFVSADPGWEPTETGRLKEVTRLGRSWSNMRSLMDLYYSFTDSVSNDDIKKAYAEDNNGAKFPIPSVKGGDRRSVVIQPTDDQAQLLTDTMAAFDSLPDIEDPYERNKERLRLMDRARKISLDVRAAVAGHPGKEKGGKLDKIAEEVKRIYTKFDADKGTQLVFLDRSVPKSKGDDKEIKEYDELIAKRNKALLEDNEAELRRVSESLERFDPNEIAELRAAQAGGWNAYQQIKDNLIAQGIPAKEIRFVQEATNDAQKQALFDAVNAGEVRVLIGSTPRMGAGTNVQQRLVGLHHADVTWKPSDIEQREGRIIRQGNKLLDKYGIDNFEVEILAYATERTIDSKMWSLNSAKLKTINAIRNYDGSFSMDFDDNDSVSMAEMAALASGNPLLLERVKLDSDINNLEILRKQHQRKTWGYKSRMEDAENDIRNAKPRQALNTTRAAQAKIGADELAADLKTRSVTVEGQTYTNHSDAVKAAEESRKTQQGGDEEAKFSVKIGDSRVTSMNGAFDKVYAALGDDSPFLAKVAGKEYRTRTDLAREVAKLATEAGPDMVDGETKLLATGQMLGFTFEANMSRGSYRGYEVDFSLVDADGRTVTSTISRPQQDSKIVTSMLSKPLADLDRGISPGYFESEARMAVQRAEKAEKELPDLRTKANMPFAKEAELAEKRARLAKVIAALAGNGAATNLDYPPGRYLVTNDKGEVEKAPRYLSEDDIDQLFRHGWTMAPVDPLANTKQTGEFAGNDTDVVFSRVKFSRTAQGQANGTVEQTVADIVKGWATRPKIVVAFDMNDERIPERVRMEDQKQRSGGASGAPEGFYYKGTVYLMSSKLATPEDVARVLFHEALGHHGLRSVFGKKLNSILNRIAMARKSEVDAKMAQYGLKGISKVDRLTAAEEILAEMAQTKPNIGFVREAIAAIRTWLRDHIPGFKNMALTDDEIIRSYIVPARNFVERGGTQSFGMFAPSMARDAGPRESDVSQIWFYSALARGIEASTANVAPPMGWKATIKGLVNKGLAKADEVEWSGVTSSQPGFTITEAMREKVAGGLPLFSRTAAIKKAGDVLNESFNYPGTVSKWHTTVGSMYNLAERNQDFKQVFNATQDFLNDVSYYGTEAADMAPKIMPKLETLKDLVTKQPISYEDNKAIAAPIFQGTLSWARDVNGRPVLTDDLRARAADMTAEQKAQDMLRAGKLDPSILRMWQGMEQDHYEAAVNSRYENVMLKPGVVWTDAELKSIFKLNDAQVGLYHEFRNAINTSIDNAAKAAMLRTAGKDVQAMRDMVMDAPTAEIAGLTLRDHLQGMAQDNPDRSDELIAMANEMMDQADKAETLKKEGYAPLSRFGHYTVDVVVNGERKYFSMFESKKEANRVANLMRQEYGAGNVAQATMSEREFEQFQGITPESMELFGNMLGLDSTGNEAQDKAFQTYLRKTKANRSAMKRLIHRKGIAGYSEDVGRVLAAFVYSNARQTAGALNLGKLSEAVNETQGELKDVAIGLQQYVTKPQEEAQAIRGLMFAQYLGGSIASMMVNLTQPMAISFPYLSQYGAGKAAKALTKAYADMKGGDRSLEGGLQQALKIAEEQGIVAPQEVHQLMAQAQGKASLHGGDGTKLGNFMAKSGNAFTKLALGWGKLFGWAEQINRKATFIAAYRMAAERGDANPFEFAKKAVNETQFINNRGNKMQWGRGPIGATLMTFKSYSINYLELLHRMATRNGPEGKKAAAIMLGMLLLMAGAGGLPFADDLNDLLDFLAQRMGYNFSTKKAKQEFLENVFGKSMADFIDRGITGLPGSPIDVSGRMSMANLLPGTGLLLEKRDHSRDAQELLGPVGDMAKRAFTGVNSILDGDIKKALLAIAPKAISNAAQGFDMSQKGYYADTKGYKVLSTTPGEAVAKAIGFQPQSVSMVQESNAITQRMKDTYALHAEKIRSEWAKGVFEHDPDQIQKARDMLKEWNDKNPDQRIIVRIPDVMKKARDMAKDKEQRIADTAPKAMRAQLQREIQQRRALQ